MWFVMPMFHRLRVRRGKMLWGHCGSYYWEGLNLFVENFACDDHVSIHKHSFRFRPCIDRDHLAPCLFLKSVVYSKCVGFVTKTSLKKTSRVIKQLFFVYK